MPSYDTTVEDYQEAARTTTRRAFVRAGGAAAGAIAVAAALPTGAEAAAKRPRWGFLIDLEACIGCKACSVACKTEFEVPLGVFRSSVKELEVGTYPKVTRAFVPWLCNHCANPVCVDVCPVDEVEAAFTWPDNSIETFAKRATYQRPDGLVLVDQDRCIGCGQCVDECPYGVRFLNPLKRTTSADAIGEHPADKCDLCVHRLDAGLVPACVNTCQGNARLVGDLNDPDSAISRLVRKKQVRVLLPETGTKPQCRYVALNPEAYVNGKDTKDEI